MDEKLNVTRGMEEWGYEAKSLPLPNMCLISIDHQGQLSLPSFRGW